MAWLPKNMGMGVGFTSAFLLDSTVTPTGLTLGVELNFIPDADLNYASNVGVALGFAHSDTVESQIAGADVQSASAANEGNGVIAYVDLITHTAAATTQSGFNWLIAYRRSRAGIGYENLRREVTGTTSRDNTHYSGYEDRLDALALPSATSWGARWLIGEGLGFETELGVLNHNTFPIAPKSKLDDVSWSQHKIGLMPRIGFGQFPSTVAIVDPSHFGLRQFLPILSHDLLGDLHTIFSGLTFQEDLHLSTSALDELYPETAAEKEAAETVTTHDTKALGAISTVQGAGRKTQALENFTRARGGSGFDIAFASLEAARTVGTALARVSPNIDSNFFAGVAIGHAYLTTIMTADLVADPSFTVELALRSGLGLALMAGGMAGRHKGIADVVAGQGFEAMVSAAANPSLSPARKIRSRRAYAPVTFNLETGEMSGSYTVLNEFDAVPLYVGMELNSHLLNPANAFVVMANSFSDDDLTFTDPAVTSTVSAFIGAYQRIPLGKNIVLTIYGEGGGAQQHSDQDVDYGIILGGRAGVAYETEDVSIGILASVLYAYMITADDHDNPDETHEIKTGAGPTWFF